MISVTIHSPSVELGADWDDLLSRAHPNVFMSPTALRAADATMFAKVHVLLAWDDSVQPRRLVGLWAVQARRQWPLWSTILDSLPFSYSFLSSPIVDPGVGGQVMSAFCQAIAEAPNLPNVILMKLMDTQAASYRPLVDALAQRGGRVLTIKTENRPVIWRATQVKATGERRKKLRQSWKRMSAIGATAMVFVSEPDAVAVAVETFLQLEFKSWKGAAGTALLCRDEDATFVRRLIVDLASQGKAAVQALQIDGRTIATQVLLFSGTMAYTWKTAFDQAFAKFSPGVILIERLTEHLFASSKIAGIDSCSHESSFMAQLWPERRAMADILVNVGPGTSVGFWIEAARQLGRERLKGMRDKLHAFRARAPQSTAAAVPTPARKAMPMAEQTTLQFHQEADTTLCESMPVAHAAPPLAQDADAAAPDLRSALTTAARSNA